MWQINRLKTNCTASRELIYWGFEGFFFYPFSLSFFGGGTSLWTSHQFWQFILLDFFLRNVTRIASAVQCLCVRQLWLSVVESLKCTHVHKRPKGIKFETKNSKLGGFFLPLRPKWDKPPPIIIRNIIIQSFWQRISSILFVQNLVRNTWSQNKSFWMLPLWGHWGLGQLRQIGSPHEMPNKGTYWAV